MISYYPLEELDPPVPPPPKKKEVGPVETPEMSGLEETELNYVIMAFIVGVVLLAVSDSIRA